MRLLIRAILSLALLAVPRFVEAQPLIIDGTDTGNTSCPGGTVTSGGRACIYGGTHTFDYVDIRNRGRLEVVVFNGSDRNGTGNAVIIASGRDPGNTFSIRVDQTSRVTAKGKGYQGVDCDNGAGPVFELLAGGRGGCAVRDSGGGGGHFGRGGKGTKDCFLYDPVLGYNDGADVTCTFPQEWEEACGYRDGGSCTTYANNDDPDRSGFECYGGGNTGQPLADPPPPGSTPSPYDTGKGDALPDVAGRAFWHSIFQSELGAAGGDKGCRDGYESGLRAGAGGGRIVLFAANGAENGVLLIDGRVIADGNRGCSLGNDSAGAGAGGTILLVGDTVEIGATARISAHGGRGGDSQPKCLPCTSPGTQDICETGQLCTALVEPASGNTYNLCSPCNCTPCTGDGDCTFPGQTCQDLGGDLGLVCADGSDRCTPYDAGDDEGECTGTQNDGVCDDCAGGGGGGIINLQSRQASIDPAAIFDVRGGPGGICPICSGESGGGAGELQLDGAYVGEYCNGYDHDGVAGGGDDDVLLPTGSLTDCKTADEVFDLSGNASEWTSSKTGETNTDPVRDIYQLHGGSYLSPEDGLACDIELAPRAADNAVLGNVGFRCCADP